MAFAKKSQWLATALVFALALPGLGRAGEVTGNCDQSPDNPPARGQTGSISIVTTPEKAVAYLNGEKLGFTPIDTAFTTGRFSLTIMLNGEELVKKRINICAGEKTTWEGDLKMPYGSVAIKTDPLKINARITVDGEEVGSTKGGILTINHLEAGTRVFRISHGSKHKEVSVNVLPEETVDLNVDLRH